MGLGVGKNFRGRDGGRAKLTDFYTRSDICDYCRLRRATSTREHGCKVRGHGVAGANNVIDLTRNGRHAHDLARGGKEYHAVLTEREEQVLHP